MKKNITRFWYTNLSAMITLIIGIIFAVNPWILAQICKAAGILLMLAGVVLLALYFIKKRENGYHAVYGGLFLIGGILLYLIPSVLTFLIPVLFGLWVLGSSGTGMYRNFVFRSGHKTWWLGFAFCTIGAILGVYIITRPTAVLETTVRAIGIAMAIFAVLRIVSACLARKIYQQTSPDFVETSIKE